MVKPLRWTSKRRETPNTIATTIDLPPELWLEILSYLPDIYFRKMMGVSRILYALALREIYRELDLHHPNSRTMLQLNKWFEHPLAAQYTRILRIGSAWFETPGPFLPLSVRPTLWMFLKNKRQYAIDYFSRHIIPRLVSVDELTLLPNRDDCPDEPLPLLSDEFWISLKPRLRKLNYRGTIETLQQILSPLLRYNFNPPPRLTHLVISFQVAFKWPPLPIANISVFVSFLQRLEQTLESLSLRIPEQLTSIVLNLPNFPRLEHLDIRLGQITPGAGIAFTSFLSTHRERLKTLTLSLCSPQIYQDLCDISFPSLRTFGLDPLDFVVLTHTFPHVPRLQRFVSGGHCCINKESMTKKICERAYPSRPTIAYGADAFKVDLDVQLRR